jgi:hypothetical protein
LVRVKKLDMDGCMGDVSCLLFLDLFTVFGLVLVPVSGIGGGGGMAFVGGDADRIARKE